MAFAAPAQVLVEAQVLGGLRLARGGGRGGGLHPTADVEAGGGQVGRGGLGLVVVGRRRRLGVEGGVGLRGARQGPLAQAVGERSAAVHPRDAGTVAGHMLTLPAQRELSHVIAQRRQARLVARGRRANGGGGEREAELPVVVQVFWTHRRQVLAAGIQVVVVLWGKERDKERLLKK